MEGYLRKATEGDMDLLYKWVNDPSVRANSFSTEIIDYEKHQKWFENLLENDSSIQYIYIYDEEMIGQIRVKIKDEIAELGYSIRMDKRHMGHGKNILRLLTEQIKKDCPGIKKLIGNVKAENIASQKALLGAGFVETRKRFEISVNS